MTDVRRVRHPWRLGVAVAAVVVLAWAAGCAVLLWRISRHVNAGLDAVEVAQRDITPSTITQPGTARLLTPVRAEFGATRSDLDSPLLAPIRILPVLGRQLRAVRGMAGAASQVATIGQSAIDEARTALRAPHSTGPTRLAAIRQLADAAGRTDASLARVSLGTDTKLIGFVRRKHDDFADRLARIRTGVHRGSVAAEAVAELLAGPDRVLVLAANNAEMRDGSGMFLSATSMQLAGGELTVEPFRDTGDLFLPPGAVPLTGDLAARWGFLAPNQDWRNLGLAPQFDETAPLAARMWKADTGESVGDVLVLDVEALHVLLEATGPVTVGGLTVDSGNVVQYVLHDQYEGAAQANAARREQLGRIASGVLDALREGRYDPAELAGHVSSLVAGRHLLAWSADPRREQAWTAAGAAGTLDADTLLVAVQNRGANKLDQYMAVNTVVSVQPGTPGADQTRVTVSVSLRNSTPPGQPPYVAGSGSVAGVAPGEYLGYVTVTMPISATDVTLDGSPRADVEGPVGVTRLVAALRTVAPGGANSVVVSFVLPVRHGHLQVASAARIPAATVRLAGPSPAMPDERRPRIQW